MAARVYYGFLVVWCGVVWWKDSDLFPDSLQPFSEHDLMERIPSADCSYTTWPETTEASVSPAIDVLLLSNSTSAVLAWNVIPYVAMIYSALLCYFHVPKFWLPDYSNIVYRPVILNRYIWRFSRHVSHIGTLSSAMSGSATSWWLGYMGPPVYFGSPYRLSKSMLLHSHTAQILPGCNYNLSLRIGFSAFYVGPRALACLVFALNDSQVIQLAINITLCGMKHVSYIMATSVHCPVYWSFNC